MVFTKARTVLINSVRDATNASRARSTSKSSRTWLLRCRIGYNDFGSTRPNRASLRCVDPVILAPATLRAFHHPRIRHQHLMSQAGDHFLYPRRMGSHFNNHARNRQALKELRYLLPPRRKLALPPASLHLNPGCSSCSTDPQDPLPPSDPFRFGHAALRPSSSDSTTGTLSPSNCFVSCATSSVMTSRESCRTETRDCAHLIEGSHFFAELLCFFTGRPPSFGIAPLSALITASLAARRDRGRPSHPI